MSAFALCLPLLLLHALLARKVLLTTFSVLSDSVTASTCFIHAQMTCGPTCACTPPAIEQQVLETTAKGDTRMQNLQESMEALDKRVSTRFGICVSGLDLPNLVEL